MKFTYNWLKDFIDIKISAQGLAYKLTMTGLEVKSLEKVGQDWVFEAEVTSNRPDLLSILGIAREVSAITKAKLKIQNPKRQIPKTKESLRLDLKIEDRKDCPLYSAKIIKDVKQRPSPDWLKERLELIGCRSVNNIVDITNYVLFTYGQPLHAFDLDKLEGNTIIVRRAKEGEKLVAIDGQERSLNQGTLVIADSKKAVALAGVMGGKDTEVSAGTKNILLESAKFDPLAVRRARQRLGIDSESSYRFEREVDINMVEEASLYAVNLIEELAKGNLCLNKTSAHIKDKKKTISLNISDVERIAGIAIPKRDIKPILAGLGFKIKKDSNQGLTLEVPSFRKDINLGIDLIEEIVRIWGYERIPSSIPSIKPTVIDSAHLELTGILRQTLIGQGLNEVITYSLIGKDILCKAGVSANEAIEISNPLSLQQEILRPTLLPGLLSCVAKNVNHRQSVCVFEIAHIFKEGKESLSLGIAICGARHLYLDSGRQVESLNIFYLKGIIESALKNLGIRYCEFILKDMGYFDTGHSVNALIGKKNIGFFGQVLRRISEVEVKEKPVFFAEFNLDEVFPCADLTKKFKPLPLFPSVQRDMSLLLKEEIAAKEILAFIQETRPSLLNEVKVVDYYKGEQIPSGFKGITLSCIYLSRERTLTDEEVNAAHLALCDKLRERFSAQFR